MCNTPEPLHVPAVGGIDLLRDLGREGWQHRRHGARQLRTHGAAHAHVRSQQQQDQHPARPQRQQLARPVALLRRQGTKFYL